MLIQILCYVLMFAVGIITMRLSKIDRILMMSVVGITSILYIAFSDSSNMMWIYSLIYVSGIVFVLVMRRIQAKITPPKSDSTWNSIDVDSNGETVINSFKVYNGGK